jgi:hypothetical protein
MSESAAITIRRQVLDVEVEGTQVDGLALQRRLPAWCADVLSPTLETELARIDPRDGCLHVEHLEVDVSVNGLDRLEDQLVEALRAALADFFRQHPIDHSRASGAPASGSGAGALEVRPLARTVDDALVEFLSTGRLPWSVRLPAGMPLEQFVVASWDESAPGGMPPPSMARLAQVLVSATSRRRLLLQFTPSLVGRLLRAWSPGVAARAEEVLRVVDQNRSAPERAGSPAAAGFPRALWDAALAAAAEERSPAALVLARTAWGRAAREREAGVERENRAAAVLLERRWPGVTGGSGATPPMASGERSGGAPGAALDGASDAAQGPASSAASVLAPEVVSGGAPGATAGAVLDQAPVLAPGAASGCARGATPGAGQGPAPGAASVLAPGAAPGGARGATPGAGQGPAPGAASVLAPGARSGGAPGAASNPSPAADAAKPAGDEMRRDRSRVELPVVGRDGAPHAEATGEDAGIDESGGILVDNAGLVVVHPFVPRFFEALGVAAGDELLDPARALCLLHHLATAEPTAPEHRLTLAKVFCEVPMDQPVEADVRLTEAEVAEANALLEAAIRHWEALRATSPDGLRDEFLRRPGMLSADLDGGWLLRVETRTSDILLDQLPWGISMVQLPWMSRLMRVEWR